MTPTGNLTATAVLSGAAAGATLVGYPSLALILALLAVAAILSAVRDLLHKEDRS